MLTDWSSKKFGDVRHRLKKARAEYESVSNNLALILVSPNRLSSTSSIRSLLVN
jgi:hypothetical protein